MTARSKAYTRIGCLPDCWSDRTLRPVRRPEAPISCIGHVRGLSATLRPGDFEILAASPAAHAARPSCERLALTAARADGVALGAALGETPTDFENGLERIEPRDAVPRPAAKFHVQVGPQASPHPSHDPSSVRLVHP